MPVFFYAPQSSAAEYWTLRYLNSSFGNLFRWAFWLVCSLSQCCYTSGSILGNPIVVIQGRKFVRPSTICVNLILKLVRGLNFLLLNKRRAIFSFHLFSLTQVNLMFLFVFSLLPYLRYSSRYLMFIVTRWRLQARCTMVTTFFHTNLSMLGIATVSNVNFNLKRNCDVKFYVLVRNVLVMFALFSLVGAVAVFVTSIMLIIALRKVRFYLQ